MADRRTAVVIGGGVAGIAAAVSLAESGFRVELVEKRPMLGGRASSFVDHQTGLVLDACQHGTMRCCTALADLLDRLGVHHLIRYDGDIRFVDSDGKRSTIRSSRLPAPMHTAPSFLRFRSLALRDKVSVARALLAMLHVSGNGEKETDIAQWFRAQGVTEHAIRRFFKPVLVSACNEELEHIACRYAFKVFRDGFLSTRDGYHFGVPTVPLGALYTDPTRRFLEERGGSIRLHTIVDRLEMADGRVTGVVLRSGETIAADCVVCTLQPDLLLRFLPSDIAASSFFAPAAAIELTPIVGVHIWFNRIVDCPSSVALLDRRTDWIFNKTELFGRLPGDGTYLSMVVSADRELTAMPAEAVLELVLSEVRESIPDSRSAQVIRWRVLKERKATFVPKPGVDQSRLEQRSPVPGLAIAGEWTNTGWPSTMESAARSGYLATGCLCIEAGLEPFPTPTERPAEGLARLFMSH